MRIPAQSSVVQSPRRLQRVQRDKSAPASTDGNPYDALPYRSRPIEWSAPERLALCSLLHGGPTPRLDAADGYRVLELGCGDGANLLPLAYYRPHAGFVGVDGSRRAMELAESRRRELGLSNFRQFVHASFEEVGVTVIRPLRFYSRARRAFVGAASRA